MATRTSSHSSDGQHLDAVFALLRDPRRRELLAVLSDRDAPVTLTELATAVARRERGTDREEEREADRDKEREADRDKERETDGDEERGTDGDGGPSKPVKSVAATLHHRHLPRLADHGVIAYDAEAKTVTDASVESLARFRNVIEDGE